MALELRNPHSILAALQTRPRDVVEIKLHSHQPHGAWKDVAAAAESAGVRVRRDVSRSDAPQGPRRGRSKQTTSGTERRGAGAATVREREGVGLGELWKDLSDDGSARGVWVALDHLQDPHNVGAVFRTAAFFGVRGVVMTRDQSARLSAVIYDIAAGGMEYVPFTVQTNLSRTLDSAKKAGLWILGTSEHASEDITEFEADRPWLLVLGSEQKGMRRLTTDKCDVTCRLTPRGEVTSLNVSVAAALMISALTPNT